MIKTNFTDSHHFYWVLSFDGVCSIFNNQKNIKGKIQFKNCQVHPEGIKIYELDNLALKVNLYDVYEWWFSDDKTSFIWIPIESFKALKFVSLRTHINDDLEKSLNCAMALISICPVWTQISIKETSPHDTYWLFSKIFDKFHILKTIEFNRLEYTEMLMASKIKRHSAKKLKVVMRDPE